MRMYKVFTRLGNFSVEADEIKLRCDFHNEFVNQPLVFYRGDNVLAVFKEWQAVVDMTEKQLILD